MSIPTPLIPVGAALPKNGGKVEHRPALNHANVGAALRTIQDGAGHIDAVQCLEFLTLTACRNGEARGATWAEIDLQGADVVDSGVSHESEGRSP